jgi:hypothetical protein
VRYTGSLRPSRLKPKDETYEEYHDRLRAQGKERIPDDVAPGIFGDELDTETEDNLLDLMEEQPNG